MMDYTLNPKNSYRYVLNYELIEEQIKINFSKEGSEYVPRTKDSEIVLLELMKRQVVNAKETMEQKRKKVEEHDNWLFMYVSLTCIAYGIIDKKIISIIAGSVITTITLLRKQKYNKDKILLADYEKNLLYIEHENEINETIKEIIETYGITDIQNEMNLNHTDDFTKEELLSILSGLCHKDLEDKLVRTLK